MISFPILQLKTRILLQSLHKSKRKESPPLITRRKYIQKFVLGDQDYKRALLNNKILEKGVSIDPATVKQIRKANYYEEKFAPYSGVQLYIYTE